jgi:hypothetical protein
MPNNLRHTLIKTTIPEATPGLKNPKSIIPFGQLGFCTKSVYQFSATFRTPTMATFRSKEAETE